MSTSLRPRHRLDLPGYGRLAALYTAVTGRYRLPRDAQAIYEVMTDNDHIGHLYDYWELDHSAGCLNGDACDACDDPDDRYPFYSNGRF